MAPAEFPDDDVAAVGESVTHMDGMVAALAVVLPVLLVLSHDGVRGRVEIGFVRHRARDSLRTIFSICANERLIIIFYRIDVLRGTDSGLER